MSHPTEVYNLAAQSFVPTSWNQPVLTGEFTGLGVTRMLEAIRQVDPSIRFYQASSSEMFGKVREVPQTESTPFHPRSPYGVAKAYGHFLTVNYRESYGLLRRLGDPVQPRIAAAWPRVRDPQGDRRCRADRPRTGDRAADGQPRRRARLGLCRRLRPGDVADAAAARARRLRHRDRLAHSVRELCRIAFERVGLDYERHVTLDPAFLRPAEVDHLLGDADQGADGARLGADGRLRGAHRDDGRRRRRPTRGAPFGTTARRRRGSTVRILVTGATGFVGRWLAKELADAGHEPIPTPSSGELDIRDQAAVERAVRTARPDAIAHLAAIASRRGRGPRPAIGQTEVNVGGNGQRPPPRRAPFPATIPVLVASSSEVYAPPKPGWRAARPSGATAGRPTDDPYPSLQAASPKAVALEAGDARAGNGW